MPKLMSNPHVNLKRVFGRRTTETPRSKDISEAVLQPGEGDTNVELEMNEVAAYAAAMAKHRGYPDAAADMIARRVVFLERRGFGGLTSLYDELLRFRDEPLVSRFNRQRPDGKEGGRCPFYAGIDLEPSFDMLTALSPEERLWIEAPSNPLLLVPKLAEWLRPTGRRAVLWWARDQKVPGYIVVEGYRLAMYGRGEYWELHDNLRQAEHIGFSDCPDDFEPAPEPRSGITNTTTLKARHIAMMEDYLRSRR